MWPFSKYSEISAQLIYLAVNPEGQTVAFIDEKTRDKAVATQFEGLIIITTKD